MIYGSCDTICIVFSHSYMCTVLVWYRLEVWAIWDMKCSARSCYVHKSKPHIKTDKTIWKLFLIILEDKVIYLWVYDNAQITYIYFLCSVYVNTM